MNLQFETSLATRCVSHPEAGAFPDHWLAVVGHRAGVEAPNWSNQVSINRLDVGNHLGYLHIDVDATLLSSCGVF